MMEQAVPGGDGVDAERDQDMAFAGAGRTRHKFSLAVIHSSEARQSRVGPGMEHADRSSSSSVLVTGNAAAFMRVRALEASQAVISASIRVRSSSSGAHRWVSR
jgi:hypothetical protein